MSETSTSSIGPNPYVGPRSLAFGEPIFGRNAEIDELLDLLIAHRILLVYAPSGAGKSSLLEAGVRPELVARGFQVLPTIRVNQPGAEGDNRYLSATLASIGWQPDGDEATDLAATLERIAIASDGGGDVCLFFDQFEELFTLDPADQPAKRDFIRSLGSALRSQPIWAVFAMREDFIARLDPLVAEIPGRLATRYRLELLSASAARVAIRGAARSAGVDFTADAANELIDDLRRVRVDRGDGEDWALGPVVEPVNLQVACRRLWERRFPS